ncbi:MAG: methyltransferase [Fushun chilo suppressalis flavivirus 1]|nr:MAG: methyltransferase [Fushun chilo suppressalis flavivirus 1]
MINYDTNPSVNNTDYLRVYEKETELADLVIWNDEENIGDLQVNNYWQRHAPVLRKWVKACLKKGGSLLVKARMYGEEGTKHLAEISKGFTKMVIIKPATTPEFSLETFVLLRRYKGNTQQLCNDVVMKGVLATLDNQRYERMLTVAQMLRQLAFTKGINEQLGSKRSWTGAKGFAEDETQNIKRCGAIPVEVEVMGVKFEPKIMERFDLVKTKIRRNKANFSVRKIDRVGWKHQVSLGSYDSKVPIVPERHTVNKTIADGLHATFGWDTVNSVIGHTQSNPKAIRESMINVFDKPLAKPSADIIARMAENVPHMKTEAGKAAEGKCRLLNWQEACDMANKKGAAGLFEGYANLADFIARDGKRQTEELIDSYRKGRVCANKDTMREKREPKKRKDVDSTGRLMYNELEGNEEAIYEGRNLNPRFIQYGDCADRMADIVLFGDMLKRHGEEKLYKGSVGGTPPWHVGNVLKACWNRGRSANFNERFEKNYERVMGVKWEAGTIEADMAALSEDFSKFDTTVSLEDLVTEMKFVMSFYPKSLHPTIENRYRHKIWSIVVDDFGNIFLREGRRGSGDIMTSFGNSFLNSLLSAVVQQKALGITAEEYWKPSGKLTYVKSCAVDSDGGFSFANSKIGVYEVSRITQFCDGDDKVVIGSAADIEVVAQKSQAIWLEAGKNVKSDMTRNFEEISFCSNSYKPVSIGKGVAQRCGILPYSQRWKNRAQDRVMYLPSRPLPEIVGKLGCTLKIKTMTDAADPESVDITRGKLASALLLYPHFLTIRFFCLMMIAKIDAGRDGIIKLDDIGQLREHKIQYASLSKALFSVYGVTDWDDIHRVDALYERDGTKALIYNFHITKGIPIKANVEYITPKSVVQRLVYRWPELKKIETQCAYCNLLIKKSIDISGPTERQIAERRLTRFAKIVRRHSTTN